jgi:hypothetical protein
MTRPIDPNAYYLGTDVRRWLAEARAQGAREAREAMQPKQPRTDTRTNAERFADLAAQFEPRR